MENYIDKWMESMIPWLMTHGLKVVLIAIGAFILYHVGNRIIHKAVKIAVVPDPSSPPQAEIMRENTLIRIFSAVYITIIFSVAALMILQEAGLEIAPILAGAGIIGLAVGFGGQYLIRDIVTGLFIILENQYRIGDIIKIDDTGGMVEDISLRKTTLRDLDGTVHHIPNGEIKKVSNLSKNYARVNLNIGIAYHSNLQHVIEVINNTGIEMAEDPEFKDFIIKPPAFLRIDDFSDSSIIVKILGDTMPMKQWDVTGELRKRLKIAFDREGIEIPFPQRVIHMAGENVEKKKTD
jgi:small conductance mechanosensitive channel